MIRARERKDRTAKGRKNRGKPAHPPLWPLLALAAAASLAGALLTTRAATDHKGRTRRMAEYDSVRMHAVDSVRAASARDTGFAADPGVTSDSARGSRR